MPSIHVVLLSYRRPDNIAPIVETCLSVNDIERIHVIDQADTDHRLRQTSSSPKVLTGRARNIGAGRRLFYAAALDCDLVIAIDDDLFLTQAQIAGLIARALEDPARVHGVWGQLILNVDNRPRLKSGIMNVDRPVDILNRVYAFTPEHARNALRIAGALNLQRDSLGPVDDILLSFAAQNRPMCHALGDLRECKTSNEPGIAVWKQPGFEQIRTDIVEKLRRLGRSWRDGRSPSRWV